MADGSSGGGNTFLGFMVGGLLVIVAVLGFFMYSGHMGGSGTPTAKLDVNVAHR
ncbi:MAG TPA: hypothetical protein VG309_05230 [Rhizomicrobium sp.]|jgi:hypothetical protein|nr:hypothetical protein [Rhizomicrobium sp.]